MTCSHLKKLYTLCRDNGLRISSSDLIKIVCTECGEQEVCPSNLMHDDLPATSKEADRTLLPSVSAPDGSNSMVHRADGSPSETSE